MAIVAMEIELPEEIVDELRRIAAEARALSGEGHPGPVDLIERYVTEGILAHNRRGLIREMNAMLDANIGPTT